MADIRKNVKIAIDFDRIKSGNRQIKLIYSCWSCWYSIRISWLYSNTETHFQKAIRLLVTSPKGKKSEGSNVRRVKSPNCKKTYKKVKGLAIGGAWDSVGLRHCFRRTIEVRSDTTTDGPTFGLAVDWGTWLYIYIGREKLLEVRLRSAPSLLDTPTWLRREFFSEFFRTVVCHNTDRQNPETVEIRTD